tara:strand:+ start:24477 stop:24656 length:180 start_codon:yes stop_codon:yes gene_type:complete
MDRRLISVLGHIGLIFILYLLAAFICADINPFSWHWIARLGLISSFLFITVFYDLKFGK